MLLCSSWTTTIWPSYNGQTSFEISFSPNSFRTKIESGLDDVRKVAVFVTSAYDITGREKKINGLAKLAVPYKVCCLTCSVSVSVNIFINWLKCHKNKLRGRPLQYPPAPCKLTFDLLTLKVVSESIVMWVTSMPILVFLSVLCSRLRPDVRDRQTDRRQTRIIA